MTLDTSNDHPGRHALPLDRLAGLQARRAASAWAAGVRDAARGGLRAGQAPGHGLRHDHRPRHDRRSPLDRRAPRRVRLRGAHRPLPRRAPGGPRPLLRDHRRGPRMAAGPFRRRRAVRRLPLRAGDRMRPGPPLLQRRRAPHRAPPPAPGGAVQRLGGPQRRARPRAQPARRDLRRHPRRIGIGGSDDHAGS